MIFAGADVNFPTKETALHSALRKGYSSKALKLIEAGANIHIEGQLNRTALYMATAHNLTEIVKKLIALGADLNH